MRKKQSIGVRLTGWGLIIYYSLILILPFLNLRRLMYNLFSTFHSSLQLVCLVSTVILLGYIIGSFYILQQKELGRSLVVFLAIIDIPHLIVGKAIYNNLNMRPIYIRNFFLIPVSVIINLMLLYFLNHPRVKAQFK